MPTLKVGIQTHSVRTSGTFELIYFDAFAPNAQPELWTEEIFKKMFAILKPGGVLTTYSSKGTVRRAMQAAGFSVEKIPGPPGKREIVRAVKI
jgi:tRNA U34 5-methylaminomethyl-2-thiouridine-forming methyltransferase MnmC